MNILRNFLIVKNNSNSCLAGKIFVHFLNIVLWTAITIAAFVVTFIPATPDNKFIGFLCLMVFILDLIFMSSIEAPVLKNPFKKEAQEKENIETVKETLTEFTEEFNKSVTKASKVNESDIIDHSIFD